MESFDFAEVENPLPSLIERLHVIVKVSLDIANQI